VEEFRKRFPAPELQRLTDGELAQQEDETIPELRRMQQLDNFFFEVLNKLSSKTRSIIDFSLLGFLYGLLQDPCNTLLFRHASTFTPEDCYTKGKIVVINLPVKKYHAVGRDCQIMFKYIWQRAMEARDTHHNGRPVFLWADEAQHFLHAHDAEYQATARSSRIATVYISQNLPNYYANMGGERSAHRVKSFIGTLGTKIFHANADIETNTYAADLIGEAYTEETQSAKSVAGGFSASETTSWVLRKMVRPEEFVGLKTGGPDNDYKVVGYMHVQGKRFASGFNHKAVTFSQYYVALNQATR
jgi:type IV secretory pathway TraG/TraD family ATPase VirD4